MNITLEKIDNLRERANVSYAEAKEALEKNEGNMIDAIIYLESENRTVYDRAKREDARSRERERMEQRREKFQSGADDFTNGLKKMIKTLNETRVVMYNDARVIFDVSMTITLLVAAFMFPLAAGIFIIGLFTNNKFKIVRKGKQDDKINSVLDKAAKMSQTVAENLKEKVKDFQENNTEEHQEM